ncbi:flagellar basal body-associated FliL family protein [Neorhizobium lilium]|uniref:Flagellar protein FliL n=1 Tax=Neorhizobium lilium TaxID=2503024 RepID=A0A444LFP7_9HYPH|nr:flagellar basal body-associated FliL family protein [Neorhizobium lilium]RWX77012.1 flagellar basal body-associated FliL family protein [Neorhizobium lilium]
MTDSSVAAEPPKKKSAVMLTAIAVVALTLVGGGGGWVVGKLIAPAPAKPEAESHAAPAGEHGAPAGGEHGAGAVSHVKQLEPIIANLAYPSDSLVRLEISLIFGENVDEAVAGTVQEDILAYMRTVSLQQIQGPRGFSYLRDDLKERAKLRSQGKVADLVFRTFVIE